MARQYAQRGVEAAPATLGSTIHSQNWSYDGASPSVRWNGCTRAENRFRKKWGSPRTPAKLLLDLGNKDEAKQVVDSLQGTSLLFDLLKARVEFANSQWKDTIDTLQLLLPRVAGIPNLQRQVHYWLGQCHEQQGDPNEAIQAYRRAIDVDWSLYPPQKYWPKR